MTGNQEGIGRGGACVVSNGMIKNKLLLVAIIAASVLLPAAVGAQGISIQIGDQPFYNHGPRYWANDYEMVWVPGHMSRGHHWIHGHYIRAERNGNYHNDYRR